MLSKKSPFIAARIEKHQSSDSGFDAHYLGYFECFQEQAYYEAHDVLEELWLVDRSACEANFYKGLIQFAGAFVHLKKNRLEPAYRLFLLAENNFTQYPDFYWGIDLKEIIKMAENWRGLLKKDSFHVNPWSAEKSPQIPFPKKSS